MAKTFISALEAECVIFDLDGTLVDTAPDLLATLNVLLGELGRRPLTLPEIKSAIGHGAKALLRNGANLTGEPLSEDQIETLFVKYIAYYSAHITDHTAPFPGAIEVLEACREAGVKLAVCTNKLDSLSHQVLAALRLDGYFDAVIGSDTLGVQKPDPETVLEYSGAPGRHRKRPCLSAIRRPILKPPGRQGWRWCWSITAIAPRPPAN